ncbi:MAG: sodium:calcium antiporter [Actinobacteria bacterium HGW-Actinobacteria-6]|jgi:cation:H+ antiporter|nr:MAG: sodium:calcium antiporter [Actinobacteria bacterium HGW-Actinobacteria-6]
MLLNLAYIIGGLVLLTVGAEGLVRGSTGLALRLGVTALMIGLTVVAFGTGSPELFLGIQAARAGDSGLALGNVVGSNISNIALVLGVAAVVKPMRVRSELIRREMPLMIGATVILALMLADARLTRLEGVVLIAGAVVYTVMAYMVARASERSAVATEFDEALAGERRPVLLDVGLLVVGLSALLIGASVLLKGAVAVASDLGVSQVVIGLTVLAIGTSLPELATSVTSTLRGEADVAFGNVIGSNVLNILAVLGVVAVIHPFDIQGLRPLDVAVMVGSAVVLLPLMWRGSVLNRWEGAGLLLGYGLYLYSLVQ